MLSQKQLDIAFFYSYYGLMSSFQKTQQQLAKETQKYNNLLNAGYQLFIEQGVDAVSIQEIAERAGVAKGTFYLYFKDKDDLREQIITQKSNQLFQRALSALHQTNISKFEDQVVFVIDYVVDVLAHNREALKLIDKNLSLGIFNHKMNEFLSSSDTDIIRALSIAAERCGIALKNPRILLYMIIELASSTCFSCILYSEPLELTVFKPYLFSAIRQLIRSQIVSRINLDT